MPDKSNQLASPKRHHYIPQSYLARFASNGLLSVYDRELRQFRTQLPKDTAVQTHYYSIVDAKGKRHQVLEGMLARLDGDAVNAISRIEEQEQLSSHDRQVLSFFGSYLMLRVPNFEKRVNDFEEQKMRKIAKVAFASEQRAKEVIEQAIKAKRLDESRVSGISPKDMVEFAQDDTRYDVVISRNISLEAMQRQAKQIATIFSQMDWVFNKAVRGASFITCDNPLTLLPATDFERDIHYEYGTKDVQKVLPLSQRTCLVMLDKGNRFGFVQLSRQEVRNVNIAIALNSDRFIIASNERLLRRIVERSGLSEQKTNN